MSGLHLVHDVLDAQLIDRERRKVGRVDALMLQLEPGRPARVAAICIGGPERARRIARWVLWLSRALRAIARVEGPGGSRVPFDAVRCIGDTIQIDVDGRDLESGRLEVWLRRHVIDRIPGASRRKQ
jgi:sporulation protein YlmC with PRC-barrel domain